MVRSVEGASVILVLFGTLICTLPKWSQWNGTPTLIKTTRVDATMNPTKVTLEHGVFSNEKQQDGNCVIKPRPESSLEHDSFRSGLMDGLTPNGSGNSEYTEFKGQEHLPAPKDELILESATSLTAKIRGGKLKAEDVVRAFVEQTERVNGILNAVVDSRYPEALEEAKAIDEDIRTGRLGKDDFMKKPLLGIPFTAKESISSKGLKWTLGLVCRKDVEASEDADIVNLMKSAGAIQIGVTNVPQLNFWMETYNPVYGVTKNPYDTTRSAGGSSGGEASIIAAGGSPLGIGTDLGGSIRIPSFRCGIFGHKCSSDLTPTHGLSFMTGNVERTMVVAGPMAKYADDLGLMLKVISGGNSKKLRLDEKVDVKKLRVCYMTSSDCIGSSPVGKDMMDVLMKVVNYFSETSEKAPKQVSFENSRHILKLWTYMIKQEKGDFKSKITNHQGRAEFLDEMFKYLRGKSEYSFYTVLNLANILLTDSPNEWAKQKLDELREAIMAELGEDGVLLCPSEPYPARYHYTSVFSISNFNYYLLWNTLKIPVTQVPLGLNSHNLPLGIQVVAAPYQDRLCLAVAKELEKAFGGYVPPFKTDTLRLN